jgi:hypothetical protein
MRERSIDWSALEEAPGALQKPRGKRDKAKGRTAPGSTLRTYATLKQVNRERVAETRAKAFGAQAQACRDIGICGCCGREGYTIPHHHTSRGAGGEDRDTLPLLQDPCHLRLHQRGSLTFWSEAGVDPDDLVDAMRVWVAAGCPQSQLPVRKR